MDKNRIPPAFIHIGAKTALLSLFLASSVGHGLAQEAVLNARNWQLFIDDYAVARDTGFDRVVHHPRPMGIVIPADKPWETHGVDPVYFARKADGTFVCYYDCVWWAPNTGVRSGGPGDLVYTNGEWKLAPGLKLGPLDRDQEYEGDVAYATSKDGIHWDKPNLGLVDAPTGVDWKKFPPFPSPTGCSKENNLGVQFAFSDLGQYGDVADPAKRYAISTGGRAYFASEFPDFIHDKNWRSKLVAADGTFSTRGKTLSFWDQAHQEWVAIVQNTTPHWLPTRTIARFASKNLKDWHSELVLAPNTADSHSSTCFDEPMTMTPFCSEGVVFGLLSWFHSDRSSPIGGPVQEKKSGPPQGWPWPKTAENPYTWPWARKGVNEMRITVSRDGGHTWDRTSSREPWIPHGTEEDSYDRLVLFISQPVRVGDEDWFYTTNLNGNHLATGTGAKGAPYYHDRLHKAQIALYIQKHDRYVSLSTGSQVETLITKPFVVNGDKLQLNVDASRGTVRVGIAESKPVLTLGHRPKPGVPSDQTPSTDPYLMEQNVLPGFTMADCRPIEANGTEETVEFKGGSSLKSIQGRTVVLFVEMLDSDLYGFRVH